MEFVRVNEKLAQNENNITILPLKILQPSRAPYDALLVQPLSTMQSTPLRVGHIVDYIEMFYNSKRLHSYLSYLSPKEFEKRMA